MPAINRHLIRRALFLRVIPSSRGQPGAGSGRGGVSRDPGGASSGYWRRDGLTATEEAKAILDHGKSTLARGSRWDYTPLPF